jgi:crossover junction endodeoxyribonuclease RuvC
MKILGIDPGTARTGFGLIRTNGKKISFIDCGCIETFPTDSVQKRLVQTHSAIKKIIAREKPHYAVIERLFFFRNMKTVMTVSQSRGVIMMACEQYKIPIIEYTPLEIKQTLSGYGRAEKKEVLKSVRKILKLKYDPKPDDVVDALAAAICHHLKKCKMKNEK